MKKIFLTIILYSVICHSPLNSGDEFEALPDTLNKIGTESVLYRIPAGSSIYIQKDKPPCFNINGKSWWLMLNSGGTLQLVFNGRILLQDIQQLSPDKKNPVTFSYAIVRGENYIFLFDQKNGRYGHSYIYSNGKIYGPLKSTGFYMDILESGEPFFCGEDSEGKTYYYIGDKKYPVNECGVTDIPCSNISPPVGDEYPDENGNYYLRFRDEKLKVPGPVLCIRLFDRDSKVAYTYRTDPASNEKIVMVVPGLPEGIYNYINEFFVEQSPDGEILLTFCEFEQKDETWMKCRIRNRTLPPVLVHGAEPEVGQLQMAGDDWLLSYHSNDELHFIFKDRKWKFPEFSTEFFLSQDGSDAAWITKNVKQQGDIQSEKFLYYFQQGKNPPEHFLTLDKNLNMHSRLYFDNAASSGGDGKLKMLMLYPDRLSAYELGMANVNLKHHPGDSK